VTAGTLGAFVRDPSGDLHVLSNNHVLANANRAQLGDHILQPGPSDGGRLVRNVVGDLERFVPLRRAGNRVDAALAFVEPRTLPTSFAIPGIGSIVGIHAGLPPATTVRKLGRTTGLTRGTITALNVRALPVRIAGRLVRFDGAIEVQSTGSRPFSLAGDSGSVVVDRARYAVGLLFAGDGVATYLNPIGDVLAALQVALA
jgi:hypothetical protein